MNSEKLIDQIIAKNKEILARHNCMEIIAKLICLSLEVRLLASEENWMNQRWKVAITAR